MACVVGGEAGGKRIAALFFAWRTAVHQAALFGRRIECGGFFAQVAGNLVETL
jgi:hypothetical protein